MISARRIVKRVKQLGQEVSEVYTDLDQFLVMVVILMVKPYGLFGTHEVRRV